MRKLYVIANDDGQFWSGVMFSFYDDLGEAARFATLKAASRALAGLVVRMCQSGRNDVYHHIEAWRTKLPVSPSEGES